ncbi:hypothetical protein F2P81_016167 [Scophthalmus maximus]|uniref:Uncharacterized protein n=1 Tax=Scophthalmus maximus TaxID=52904 RepID=A0A6A4SMU0_SCOMX|nr:hypothetical protein F2P81_016167 [Scophthalmus maximus]
MRAYNSTKKEKKKQDGMQEFPRDLTKNSTVNGFLVKKLSSPEQYVLWTRPIENNRAVSPCPRLSSLSLAIANSSRCTVVHRCHVSFDFGHGLVVLDQYLQQLVSPVKLVPDLTQLQSAVSDDSGEICVGERHH